MIRRVLATAGATLLVGAGPATRPASTRPTYDCPRVTKPMSIDGRLDDWAGVPWTTDFTTLDGRPDAYRTRAKLAWDDNFLYVAAALESRHVRATETRHDSVLYAVDPVFELFLDPDGDSQDYCELEINALGTVMDLMMSKPYRQRGKADLTWNVDGLRSAVSVDGTLNDSSDRDRAWTVELAIPWETLARFAHRDCPAKPGDRWHIQLARSEPSAHPTRDKCYGPAPDGEPTDHSAWSPQPERTFHAPQSWGVVQFTASSAPASRP